MDLLAQGSQCSWQAVALELLRRRAGAKPQLSVSELRELGALHVAKLTEKNLDSLYYVTCNVEGPRQRLCQTLCDHRISETRAILEELVGLGADPLLLDENEACMRYDGGQSAVASADIGLLVPRDALWKVQRILYGRGYMQGDYSSDTREWRPVEHFRQLQHELHVYELWPFKKSLVVEVLREQILDEAKRSAHFCVHNDATLVFLKVDVLHGLTANLNYDVLKQRSLDSALGLGRALSRADQLSLSISRYYEQIARGADSTLQALASIARIVADPDVDWSLLVQNAIEQKAISAHLYWLTFFRKIGAEVVHADVLTELRARHARAERNWGWQLEQLFEVEPTFPRRLLEGS